MRSRPAFGAGSGRRVWASGAVGFAASIPGLDRARHADESHSGQPLRYALTGSPGLQSGVLAGLRVQRENGFTPSYGVARDSLVVASHAGVTGTNGASWAVGRRVRGAVQPARGTRRSGTFRARSTARARSTGGPLRPRRTRIVVSLSTGPGRERSFYNSLP